MELVEHVDDIYELLSGCAKLLKAKESFHIDIESFPLVPLIWRASCGGLTRDSPWGTHDYNKFIKPSELSACCRAVGFIG